MTLLAIACAPERPATDTTREAPRNPAAVVAAEQYRPRIDPSEFVPVIDNPYLPLPPGRTLLYEGVIDGEHEVIKVSVTGRTKEILGVTTTVVRDRAFADGELVEDTFDWFAQDRRGNVWYFGEDTREFEKGKVVSRQGSWEAGVDGAQPGIVMLGNPRVGDTYRQEYYRGEAEDMARVRALDEAKDLAGVQEGSNALRYPPSARVLVTEDWTPLEPRLLEHKFYASGIGVVLERVIRGGRGSLRLVRVRP